MVYSQHLLVRDLIAARLADSGTILFEADAVSLHDIDTHQPRIRYRQAGTEHEIICDAIAHRTGGQRAVCPGMGHLVQDTGAPFNALLESFLQSAEANKTPTIGERAR